MMERISTKGLMLWPDTRREESSWRKEAIPPAFISTCSQEVGYLYYQSDIFIKLFKIIYGFVMCNKIYSKMLINPISTTDIYFRLSKVKRVAKVSSQRCEETTWRPRTTLSEGGSYRKLGWGRAHTSYKKLSERTVLESRLVVVVNIILTKTRLS